MDGMKFRKCLLGISNQLSRQDLELLKFFCENEVPNARMERVRSGTDLFNALEERGKLSSTNLCYLADILRSIGRGTLVDKYLKAEGFVITPSSLQVAGAGGQIRSQAVQYLFRECLVKVAQRLLSTEVHSLVFLFETHLQIRPEDVFSATQLFTLLQQRAVLTPRDMRTLYDGLCQVGRYDLAGLVNEFMVKTGQSAYQGEQGMITDHPARIGNQNQPPVQETTPALIHGDPAQRMLPGYQCPPEQYQQGYPLATPPAPAGGGAGTAGHISRTSSASSSLSSDASLSMSTQLPSSTTTDYPPHHLHYLPGGGGGVASWNVQPPPAEPMKVWPPDSKLPHRQQQLEMVERHPSGEIKPFGLEFNVFETIGGVEPMSPPTTMKEVQQQRLLEDLAMKQGELVKKEDEITRLRIQLEMANSDKSKVYTEKLGEAEKFKQNIRELEQMLRTKNEEVVGLSYELQHFHVQMEAMTASPINEKEFYRMDKNPHGICVIFNNYEFYHPTDPDKAHNNRGGAEVDQKNLQLTFQYLRYKVEIYENLTHSGMTDAMLTLAQRDHSSYDSFICCILTHGEQHSVHGADSIAVPLLDLTGLMKMCTTLVNKPKMFFIQACRGDLEDKGHKVDPEDVIHRDSGGPKQPPNTHTIPQEADFFFGYATPLGNAAYRSRRHGSWYISELCKVLTMHAYTSNLSNMMRRVNDNICRAFTKEGYKQTSEFVDRLRKGVHFFHFSKVQQQLLQ